MIGFALFSLAPALYVAILYIRTVFTPTDMEPLAEAAGTPRDDGKAAVNDSSDVGQVESGNFWDNL
jgi:hypothetical protein